MFYLVIFYSNILCWWICKKIRNHIYHKTFLYLYILVGISLHNNPYNALVIFKDENKYVKCL